MNSVTQYQNAKSNEPSHDKTNEMACAPSEDSDQPETIAGGHCTSQFDKTKKENSERSMFLTPLPTIKQASRAQYRLAYKMVSQIKYSQGNPYSSWPVPSSAVR